MMKRISIFIWLAAALSAATVSGQTVRDVRGRLGEKTSFEPTKISVEEVRYVGINYITANDSVIMKNCAEVLRNDLDFSPFFEVVYLDSFFMRHMELQEMTLLG